jgi:hypothetical protein
MLHMEILGKCEAYQRRSNSTADDGQIDCECLNGLMGYNHIITDDDHVMNALHINNLELFYLT